MAVTMSYPILLKLYISPILDFTGFRIIKPVQDGKATEVTYSLYIDPGSWLPQWAIREGSKWELLGILTALKKRVTAISSASEAPANRSIIAAAPCAAI